MTNTTIGRNLAGSIELDDRIFSGEATVDFTENFNELYTKYIFYFQDYYPATDFTILNIRTSQDGSTFDSGASDYGYNWRSFDDSATVTNNGLASASFIRMNSNGIGGASAGFEDEGLSGFAIVYNPLDSSRYTNIYWELNYRNSFNQTLNLYGSGHRKSAGQVNGVQFYQSSGNCNGRITMVGVR